ncbi:MAG: S8 family serine peptidase [Chloroflexi bacterium]|nr:S8 family serine peptidase [Chloroflexota bacterium]
MKFNISQYVHRAVVVFTVLVLLAVAIPSHGNLRVAGGRGAAPESYRAQGATPGLFIHLANSSFDPLQDVPAANSELMYSAADVAGSATYLVQFNGPVLPEWKQAVLDAGGLLGNYIPDNAFLVRLTDAAKSRLQTLPFVRWIGVYHPAYKLAAAEKSSGSRSYRVVLAPWANQATVVPAMNALSDHVRAFGQGFSVVLDDSQLEQVARLADVVWVEPYQLRRSYNDVAAGTIMSGTTAWNAGYTGNEVTVAVADTGLDTGITSSIHLDFAGRVAQIQSWPVVYADYGLGCVTTNAGADDGADDVATGHGTHVTGSLAGNGARSSGSYKGLAYQASIVFQAIEQYTTWASPLACSNGYYLTGIPDDIRTLLTDAYGWGARVQNNSWGGGYYGVYDLLASQFDDFVHQHPDMVVVTAAGNDGVDDDEDGYVDENSISSPATAKNVLTIGASDNNRSSGGLNPGGICSTWNGCWSSDYPANPTRDDRISDNPDELAAFSSRGPMQDGRIKPDLVAPGTNILSVRSSLASGTGWGLFSSNSYYMYMGGTSMASPLAAGAAALVREYYIEHEAQTSPSAALVKATLINSAVDIAGYGNTSMEAGQPIPNNHEGWGRINLAAATAAGNRKFVDDTVGINTGITRTYHYGVTSSSQPLKVSLVWSDYAGTPEAGTTLVNNLDLRITAPDGATTYWGNQFSGGRSQPGGSHDTVNNVENVYIDSPATGTWKVEVIGQNVPQGPQPYALVASGTVTADVFAIGSVSPTSAHADTSVSAAVLVGTGFVLTSSVALVRDSQVISWTDLTINTVNDLITGTFNLTGAATGLWSVRVTNENVQSATLANAFTVLPPLTLDLQVTKSVAPTSVMPGYPLTYTIAIHNAGSASASGLVFTDTLPVGMNVTLLTPSCSGGLQSGVQRGVQSTGNQLVCPTQPGTLGSGQSMTYTLVVTAGLELRGYVVNTVTVGGAEADLTPGDNISWVGATVSQVNVYMPIVLNPDGQ